MVLRSKIILTLLLCLAFVPPVHATPIQVDSLLAGLRGTAGNPLSAGQVYTYAAGTTTAKACWYDNNKLNQTTNPVILDATGAAQVYCEGNYKFNIADSTGAVLKTWDNLTYQSISSSSWVVVPAAITYVSASQFTIVGDYSSYFPANIAVMVTIASGPITGWVTSSNYNVTNSAKTTVNVTWQSTVMTSAVNGTQASTGPTPAALPPTEAIGVIKPYGAAAAPTGYLLCDGSAVSRVTYAPLYAVIGTSFGPGDGGSTFNVPDLRGRVAIGVGQGLTAEGGATGTNRVLGAKSGAETHTQTTAELATHTHDILFYQTLLGGGDPAANAAEVGSATGATGQAGGSSPMSIMNPFLAVTYIIKF